MKQLAILLCSLFLVQAVRCTDITSEIAVTNTTDASKVETSSVQSTTVLSTTVQSTTAFSTTDRQTPIVVPVVPSENDICGLQLVSEDEQTGVKHRRCKCSDINLEVDCSFLDVTKLPQMISFPRSAHFVKFSGNKIESIGNGTFYTGKYVFELDLSHNHIDFVSIVAFKPFRKLRSLDLSHNKIWNLPSKSFEGLGDLNHLNLAYNDIVSLHTDLFVYMPNLKNLNLDTNPLVELEPKQFEGLRKLEFLNLESTQLKMIPDHSFLFTPNLKKLKLSNNLLQEVPTAALKVLDNLKYLDLSGNPIRYIKEGAFQGMRLLVILYLERMQALTTIDKYAFGDLQLLNELHCSHNYMLSKIDEKAFVKKTTNEKVRLSQLFLKQNSLDTLHKELLDWNDEVELHITDNPLYCDCNIEWMVHLKLKNAFQKHTKCYGPGHYQGITLSDLKDRNLSCGLEVSEIVMIILAGGIGILLLSLIVAFLVWRRSYSGYNRPYFRVSKKKNIDDIDYRGDDSI